MLLLKRFSEWRRRALPSVNYRTVVKHYMPVSGVIGHSLYTVHIFSPNILHSWFPLYDTAIEHSLLSTSNIGLGFYLFFLPHIRNLKIWDRVELSVFTTVLFNFGSFVAAIFLKALLPPKLSNTLKSILALGLSWMLLSRGRKYITLNDSRIQRKNHQNKKKLKKPLDVLTTI